ncbi:MAG: hypothetical protein J6A04_04055 [Clostridia bacterium]|nr:hypothetical protein [Clostridia bacterium]
MEKQKFLELLVEELKRLEEVEHVSDLAENGRYEEVDAVVAEIDYSALNEYMENEEHEQLDISDIPEQYVLTFAIYLSGSEYAETDIMEEWEDLTDALEKCGTAGEDLAETLSNYYINGFDTFAELIAGDESDDEEEDESDGEANDGTEEEADQSDVEAPVEESAE